MVTTRRQSKTIESPALPPVAPPKRKRKSDAAAASSAVQPPNELPNEPPNKRSRKGKGTTTGSVSHLLAASAKKRGPVTNDVALSLAQKQLSKAQMQLSRAREQMVEVEQRKAARDQVVSSRQQAHVDLTSEHDDTDASSSENNAARRTQPANPRHADDDDEADSRYALKSKRKRRNKKPVAPPPRQTAELRFEEDGLEEVDKAEAAVSNAGKRTLVMLTKPGPTSWTPVNKSVPANTDKEPAPLAEKKGKDKAKQKTAPPKGVPSKAVMFTAKEAIATLSLYQEGTMSIPADVDPQSRQPYEPLQTGEYLAYPVKGTYYLGSIGRFGVDTVPPPLPFSLTVPLSCFSSVQNSLDGPSESPSRHGLGFARTLPTRPKTVRPNNYCFTFGRYKGRRMDSAPIEYLRIIRDSDAYHDDVRMQQAFEDLYPRGLYETETERYTLEDGRFKGNRLDEVPKTFVWGLQRQARAGSLPKKGREQLERALEAWEKKQLDLTNDSE